LIPHTAQDARKRVGKANADRIAEAKEWDQLNPEASDPDVFAREILPGLKRLTLSQLQKATGLSNAHVSRIRRGMVPHARHWEALRALVDTKR
jgi:hypothetical protein